MRRISFATLAFAVAVTGCSRNASSETLAVERVDMRPAVALDPATAADQARVTAALADLADTTATTKRLTALESLVAQPSQDPRLTPAILTIVHDVNDPLRTTAAQVLGRLPCCPESVDTLLMLAYEPEMALRLSALEALGRLAPRSAKVQVTLRKALRDPQTPVRVVAIEAVGRQGRDAVPVLVQALEQPELDVRLAALAALHELGPEARAAVPVLQRFSADSQPEAVRTPARAALKQIDVTSSNSGI